MIGQSNCHRWGARRTALAQAFMRQHKVVQADHEPDLPPVARAAPGQTPGAAPQGRHQPTQGAIPAFHKGRLDRPAKLAQVQLLGLELSCRAISRCTDARVRNALATNLSDLLRYQNMLCRYDTMALKSLDIFSVHGFPVGLVQCESNFLGIINRGSPGEQ